VPELLELAQRIAAAARPGEQVEAYVARERGTDVRVFEGDVESLSFAQSAGVGVRVVVGGRQGFAYAGDLDERLARDALEEARDNARFATEDEHAGLPVPDGVAPAHLELWREETVSTDDKVALALELERRVRAADRRIRQVVSADYGDGQVEVAVASSLGISAVSRRSGCYVSADAVAGEGPETQTATGYSVGRAFSDLDLDKAAGDAVERATRLLGARKPPGATLAVVLDRRVTATLLAILAGTLSGEEVAKRRSLFTDRLGEEVAATSVTLLEDPTNPLAYGASPYDAEGLACRPTRLIEGGRLAAYLYDTYSARLARASSTASAVRGGYASTPSVGARALSLEPGELGQAELVRYVGEGLFVQQVSGVHSGVNPVSGDFSVGAEGLMIRDGALAEPVREITIASTIQRMLQHVLAVGADVEWLSSAAAGVSLAIGEVAMSGA
jgi:PmbA protein